MKHLKKVKLAIVGITFLIAAWVAIPQFIPQNTIEKSPTWVQDLITNKRLNLGLDLKGGLYLVLGLDIDRVLEESFQRDIEMIDQGLKKESIVISEKSFETENEFRIAKLSFATPEAKTKADAYLEKNFPNMIIHFEEDKTLYLRLFEQEVKDIREKTITQSIETLRNRIDEFGVKEPVISKTGSERIQIQFPGLTETDRIKSIIKRTAKLEFRIVSEELSQPALSGIVEEAKAKGIKFEEKTGVSLSDYTRDLNAFAKEQLPKDTLIRFQRETNERTQELTFLPFLVTAQAKLTGFHLQDARVGIDQENQLPVVNLSFNPQGASILKDLSSANIGKPMAIILDDTINSAPILRSTIPNGEAQITLGSFADYAKLMKDASDLVVVLRAGSLPTTLEFLEERTIGPSLGTDSIKAGSSAALLGGFITLCFMILYYAGSGFIAAFALIFNTILLLALLTSLGATLTLPGIAGIVLTFGMSVDANIIIFERIKENLRRNRSVASSVMDGYEKALITILDSNITTIFAGIILLQYGTGPIKGFAVTLILGILTSLFTAYFASKTISEWIYNKPDQRKISIGISLNNLGQNGKHTRSVRPPQPQIEKR
jgi:preprotein translocase subunit SecD